MENKDEKGCGTCAMFLYEDTYGNGWCKFHELESVCNICCDYWIGIPENISESE